MKRKKGILFITSISIIIIFIISFCQIKQFKFLFEIIKLRNSLPTISSDFYNEPIKDVTYKDVVYKTRNNKEITLDIYKNKEKKLITYGILLFLLMNVSLHSFLLAGRAMGRIFI